MVAGAKEVIAIGQRREGTVQGNYLEIVLGKFQIADDLGTEQTDHIRADGVLKAGINFFCNCGAADKVAPFEHENLFASFR
jgi:hypothetical protein